MAWSTITFGKKKGQSPPLTTLNVRPSVTYTLYKTLSWTTGQKGHTDLWKQEFKLPKVQLPKLMVTNRVHIYFPGWTSLLVCVSTHTHTHTHTPHTPLSLWTRGILASHPKQMLCTFNLHGMVLPQKANSLPTWIFNWIPTVITYDPPWRLSRVWPHSCLTLRSRQMWCYWHACRQTQESAE